MKNRAVNEKVYQNAGNPAVLDAIPSGARTALDLGCGAGDNARQLAARGVAVDGVTLSHEEAELAKAHCRSVHVFNLEQGLPRDLGSNYDAVIASHVLEHVCFPEPLLRAVGERLSPEGVLIVALPNLMNWRFRIRLLAGRFEYEESGTMDNTHFRWYTFRSGRRLLERNGFEVQRAFAEGHFPWFLLRRILPGRIARWADRAAVGLIPGLFGSQLVYVAKRKP